MTVLLKILICIAAAVASAVFLWAGFPRVDQPYFVWIGLVPLLMVIGRLNCWQSYLMSLGSGMLFFLGIFRWILTVSGYTLLHHLLLAVYLGSYFGLFGLAYNIIGRRCGLTTALSAAPFLWVLLEYVRSSLSFLSLPWGLLAHSQYQVPLVIQLASLTGVYGVSFTIVLVNSAITAFASGCGQLLKKGDSITFRASMTIGNVALIVAAVVLLTFSMLYGHLTIAQPITGESFKIAVVQGNIDQSQKWNPQYADFIMRTYAELSQEAGEFEPDLIVWPETATPRAIVQDPAVYREVTRIVKQSGANLLLGSSQPNKFKRPGAKDVKYFNSAFLISPKPQKAKPQRYDKIRLFPFGEYLPYKDILPWASIGVPEVSTFLPGEDFTIFDLSPLRFGVTICWENMFPDLFRQFVKNGAQLMVNLTNEAWFGKTAAPDQFLSMSVFRAVENRVFVVRCTNTGISCFIDPNGRVFDKVQDRSGADTFVRGFKVVSIVPRDSKTLYTRYGDWPVWSSTVVLAGILCWAVIGRKIHDGLTIRKR